ncbi:hypothetical protein C0J52_18453 [Blattella germanica]|nr:hypothetical protein C0J52_18453 [Blattella germanica]
MATCRPTYFSLHFPVSYSGSFYFIFHCLLLLLYNSMTKNQNIAYLIHLSLPRPNNNESRANNKALTVI